jgi:hypothetical protein
MERPEEVFTIVSRREQGLGREQLSAGATQFGRNYYY